MTTKTQSKTSVVAFVNAQIEQLQHNNRFGTATFLLRKKII